MGWNDYDKSRNSYRYMPDSDFWNHLNAYKKDADHEVVILLDILKHDVNLGYGLYHTGVLHQFNGQPVRNLTHLAAMVGAAKRNNEEFLRFDTRLNNRSNIVLETALL